MSGGGMGRGGQSTFNMPHQNYGGMMPQPFHQGYGGGQGSFQDSRAMPMQHSDYMLSSLSRGSGQYGTGGGQGSFGMPQGRPMGGDGGMLPQGMYPHDMGMSAPPPVQQGDGMAPQPMSAQPVVGAQDGTPMNGLLGYGQNQQNPGYSLTGGYGRKGY